MESQVFQSALIVSNVSIGESVRHVILKPVAPLPYQPGQFFIVRLKDEQGEHIERSYSAANWGTSGTLEFVVRIEPHGKMSGLIDHLKTDDKIEIKGPFGKFGELHAETKKIVLIAGGVGISPIRSMIHQWDRDGKQRNAQLFYGFRTTKDFLFREELEAYQDLEILPSISEEDPNWSGAKGFIHEQLMGNVFPAESTTDAFICGPPVMVKAAREKLLELGYERKQIHVEAW